MADNRIYLVAENEEACVVKAGPEFELLAENEIGEFCMTVPAMSGGKLFIRSQHHLFALQRGATLPTIADNPPASESNDK